MRHFPLPTSFGQLPLVPADNCCRLQALDDEQGYHPRFRHPVPVPRDLASCADGRMAGSRTELIWLGWRPGVRVWRLNGRVQFPATPTSSNPESTMAPSPPRVIKGSMPVTHSPTSSGGRNGIITSEIDSIGHCPACASPPRRPTCRFPAPVARHRPRQQISVPTHWSL